MATARDHVKTLSLSKLSRNINCPDCSSIDVHRSMRHGWRDFVRRLHGIFPWRCGVCRTRFYLPKRSQDTRNVNDPVLSAPYQVIEAFPMDKSEESHIAV